MFTGIVQASTEIVQLQRQPGLLTISLILPESLRDNVELGGSIAVDGVCLTVTDFDTATGQVSFDIMQQTLDVTTLGESVCGYRVNIERSAKANAEVGGHLVSGHVDAMATVVRSETSDNNLQVYYQYPAALDKYLFEKGFVALNGCSLTIAQLQRETHTLMVSYIPETLRVTTHGMKAAGSRVNIEADRQTQAIVDTVERVLAARFADGQLG